MDGTIAIKPRYRPGIPIDLEAWLCHRRESIALRDFGPDPADLELEMAEDTIHVLIVDAQATNRMVAQTMCELYGCTFEAVDSGEEALNRHASRDFDLVLMDIKMPGIDGVEATRRIRASGGPQSRIPILALTASAEPTDVAVYRQCGMDGVVEKPINPQRLLAAMNAALQVVRADEFDAINMA